MVNPYARAGLGRRAGVEYGRRGDAPAQRLRVPHRQVADTGSRPDAYFTFTTDRMLDLSATLLRQNTSDTFSMGLLAGCGGAESLCRATGFSSSPLVLTRNALPAGTHVLVVRGGTGFTVDLTRSP
jgi:hypothetical protein